ncbi:hypothetical protein ACS127_00985 [Amphibacillus sp. Q70]|uniref:hypothetical protein n=1 Tax=Amphibacillus sp. Q70 TaxID=3453416 RepID=UPI003F871FAB
MKKKYSKWTLAVSAIFIFIGSLLGQIIIYFIKGEFNYSAILGSLAGALPIILINALYVYFKKDQTPEVDERIRNNMIKYMAFSSQIIFLILMIVLAAVSVMGMTSIPISSLWIIILAYMMIIGIGSLIVKTR